MQKKKQNYPLIRNKAIRQHARLEAALADRGNFGAQMARASRLCCIYGRPACAVSAVPKPNRFFK